jgi:hypothetical protein
LLLRPSTTPLEISPLALKNYRLKAGRIVCD